MGLAGSRRTALATRDRPRSRCPVAGATTGHAWITIVGARGSSAGGSSPRDAQAPRETVSRIEASASGPSSLSARSRSAIPCATRSRHLGTRSQPSRSDGVRAESRSVGQRRCGRSRRSHSQLTPRRNGRWPASRASVAVDPHERVPASGGAHLPPPCPRPPGPPLTDTSRPRRGRGPEPWDGLVHRPSLAPPVIPPPTWSVSAPSATNGIRMLEPIRRPARSRPSPRCRDRAAPAPTAR